MVENVKKMGSSLSANRYVIPIKGNCSEKAMRVWKISFVRIDQLNMLRARTLKSMWSYGPSIGIWTFIFCGVVHANLIPSIAAAAIVNTPFLSCDLNTIKNIDEQIVSYNGVMRHAITSFTSNDNNESLIEQFIDVSTSDKCKFNYPYYLSEDVRVVESEFDASFQAYNKDQ